MERNYEYVFINTDFSKSYRKHIMDEFFWTTFPIVVLVKQHKKQIIGGYEQLVESIDGL